MEEYVKQTWENGQVITADKLNHMEGGISQFFPVQLVNGKDPASGEMLWFDSPYTPQEIIDKIQAGQIPIFSTKKLDSNNEFSQANFGWDVAIVRDLSDNFIVQFYYNGDLTLTIDADGSVQESII